MTIKYVLASLICFGLIGSALAQDEIKEVRISVSYQSAPVRAFLNDLEQGYHLRAFYKREWLDSMTIQSNFNEIPLIQALNKVFGQSNVNYRFFQNSIVLYPRAIWS